LFIKDNTSGLGHATISYADRRLPEIYFRSENYPSNILAQTLEPIYHLASERDCNSKTY
jgi:hypothetical protein